MTSVSPAVSSTADRTFAGRQTPWSNEAEQAVLGAMLMDQDAALQGAELLDDSMFYKEAHRALFRAMITLVERRDVIDPVTLQEELRKRGDLDRVGGLEYIGALVDVVPTAANVEYHARIVKDKSILRSLIETATEVIKEAYDAKEEASEVLDRAEHRVFEIAQFRRTEGFVRIKQVIWPTMERIEQLQATKGGISGVPSGFRDLDQLTGGFQAADLIVLAARPSMGKTALALNFVANAAISHQVPTAVFSLEMSTNQLVQRLLCSEGYVDFQHLRLGRLRDDDYPKLAKAAGVLGTSPIWIDDTPNLTPLAMRAKARRLKAEFNIGFLIVDYLQLVQGPPDAHNREQEISYVSRSLKALAKELDIPVVALSQLSRAPEQRGGEHRRPQLSDLRESGAIEQDADVVMFIYREEMYVKPDAQGRKLDDNGNDIEKVAELLVGKQRNGPTGLVKLIFEKKYTRFQLIETHHQPPPEASVEP